MLRTFVLYAVSKENVESSKRRLIKKKEKKEKEKQKCTYAIIHERNSAIGGDRALETLRSLETYIDT